MSAWRTEKDRLFYAARHQTGARFDTSKNGADTHENFAAYARKMLIDGYVAKVDYSELKTVTAEIEKIGVNVNQIAKHVNATTTCTNRTLRR